MPFLTINFPKVISPISANTNKQKRELSTSDKPPNKWREHHEALVKDIRAARKFHAYVNGGGKICDLPQLPPSENPDYIQCPHCLRRFGEEVANRHIPKCTDYKHNKPKSKPVNVRTKTFK